LPLTNLNNSDSLKKIYYSTNWRQF